MDGWIFDDSDKDKPGNELKSCYANGFYEDSWDRFWEPEIVTYWFNDDCYTTKFALCQKKVANDDWQWINCYGPDANWNQLVETLEAEELCTVE